MKKYFSRFFDNNEAKSEIYIILGYLLSIFQLIIVFILPVPNIYKFFDLSIVTILTVPCVFAIINIITTPIIRAWFLSCIKNNDYIYTKQMVYDIKDKIKKGDGSCLSFDKQDKVFVEIIFNLFDDKYISDSDIEDIRNYNIEYKVLKNMNIIKYSVSNTIYDMIIVPNKLWHIINNPEVIVYTGHNTNSDDIISTEDPNVLTSDIIEKYSNIFKNNLHKYEKSRIYSFVIALPNDKKLISKLKLIL